MGVFHSQRLRPVLLALIAVVVVVFGLLWWTKAITFTKTAFVEFSVPPPSAHVVDTYQSRYIAYESFDSSELVGMMSNRLAAAHGGTVSDYSRALTVTRAPDRSGMTLTARGRTPDAAELLLIDATDTLNGILRQLAVRVPTLTVDPDN
ncbi:UNVERIFIED_ORG: hypothetical protein FNL38_106388 [Nocardia globerula]|uniref:Capsular polysaccharide biosynthesis protein n=1 Tax=Nocardia globerula TaxID=1818 RepID=A0A652YLU1_NOCGL|nr:hypothetical protein [Rhodococcus globerulus]NMD59978.1 hypothetical protein [Nocardia globerula]PVX63911.1 hypothetical protein C8E04_1178 [Rhodococcus globerulus]